MMRNKDYFSEMGIDPSQLENSLDAVSDRVFTFSRYGCDGVSYRFKSRKVKYRVGLPSTNAARCSLATRRQML